MIRKLLKVFGILAVVLVVAGGVLFAIGLRIQMDGGGTPKLRFLPSASKRAEEIARHREAQRAQAGSAAPQPSAAPAAASPEAAAPVAPLAAAPAASTSPAAGSTYWTDFRGPNRDGHYQQRPIATTWPATGPKPIWKQPVGAGYASFVIAAWTSVHHRAARRRRSGRGLRRPDRT